MINIAAFDELKRRMSSDMIFPHVNVALEEIEQGIVYAMSMKFDKYSYVVNFCSYDIESMTKDDSAKLVVYHVLTSLQKKGYPCKLQKKPEGFIIDIILKENFNQVDDFLKRFY